MKKKTIVIVASAVLGASIIGGASYKVVDANYQENLEEAKAELHAEEGILSDLAVQVSEFHGKDGYLKKDLEKGTIENAKDNLKLVEDDVKAYNVKESDIEESIEFIKTTKEDIASELKIVEQKFALETELNELFTKTAINGDEVKKPALKKDVTTEKVDNLSESLESASTLEEDAWLDAVKSLIDEGNTQLEHIASAENKVKELYDKEDKDKVNKGVERKSLEEATEAVAKIKNEEIKEDFEGKLSKVETFIAEREEEKRLAEEEEARKLAESEAEKQAEKQAEQTEQAQQEEPIQASEGTGSATNEGAHSSGSSESASNGGSQSSSGSTGGNNAVTSNGGGQSSSSSSSNGGTSNSSSNSSNSGSSSNASSGSSSNSSSSKSTGGSSSNSNGGSSSSNSSSSGSKGSSNSGGSTNSGGNWSTDMGETKESGNIHNNVTGKDGDSTWESGDFEIDSSSDFCKDFGC
ncbi:hypothetical protein [Oceanobacillus sp. J11TS1]|uniref:hypothetical protein n=1 Tax=Oceanobacillus sp. J11TS1 TaxID=2807191 RepID=UPI001B28D0BF|nr:hypothetical protein [Oceanobacillus sp. J11TS1]GIO22511.1 hypothetical protein J11TS1_10920 [Oceanobacillus sp. J11TS1]